MRFSNIFTLIWLRLKLNRANIPIQLILDICIPVGAAFFFYNAASDNVTPLSIATGACLLTATLTMMRLPTIVLFDERTHSIQNVFITAGITKLSYILANLIMGLTYLSIFPIISLVIVSMLLGSDIPMYPQYWIVLFAYFVIMAGMSWILASILKSRGGINLAGNFFVLLTSIVCPIFYSPDRVPSSIKGGIDLLPATLAMDLSGAMQVPPMDNTLQSVVFALWAVIALLLGYRLFPWGKSS